MRRWIPCALAALANVVACGGGTAQETRSTTPSRPTAEGNGDAGSTTSAADAGSTEPVSSTPGALRFRFAGGRGICRLTAGDHVEIYGYDGSPPSCVVPVFMLETGVFGCPTSVVLETRPDDPSRFTYDESGHLIESDGTTYVWLADRLTAVERGGERRSVSYGTSSVWVGDEATPSRHATLDAQGRPTRITRFAGRNPFSDTTLEYEGDALVRARTHFEGAGTQTLTFERCTTP